MFFHSRQATFLSMFYGIGDGSVFIRLVVVFLLLVVLGIVGHLWIMVSAIYREYCRDDLEDVSVGAVLFLLVAVVGTIGLCVCLLMRSLELL